jgi:hypothetical protein
VGGQRAPGGVHTQADKPKAHSRAGVNTVSGRNWWKIPSTNTSPALNEMKIRFPIECNESTDSVI